MTELHMNPQQAEALAKFLMTIRPEWSSHYTTEAVRQMRIIDPSLERITRAAVRGALSPRIAKPDVLAMHGEHWKARADEKTGAVTVPNSVQCEKCRDYLPTHPAAGDPPHVCRPPAADVGTRIQALRDEVRPGPRVHELPPPPDAQAVADERERRHARARHTIDRMREEADA